MSFEALATDQCSQSGSSSDPIVAGANSCNSTPDFYQLELLEIGLCNNIDPTDSNALPNIANNCSKVFVSQTPVNVQISNSLTGSDLSGGTYTMPPLGNYAYGYVKTTNRISVKTTKYFTLSQISDNGTSGSVCWTRSGTSISGLQNGSSDPTVDCGNTPTPQFFTKVFEGISCQAAYYCDLNTYNTPSESPNSYLYLTANGVYTNISSNDLYNGTGVVTPNEITLFYRFNSPINVTSTSKNISVLFEVANNLKVRNNPVSLKIRTFGFKMSVQ